MEEHVLCTAVPCIGMSYFLNVFLLFWMSLKVTSHWRSSGNGEFDVKLLCLPDKSVLLYQQLGGDTQLLLVWNGCLAALQS